MGWVGSLVGASEGGELVVGVGWGWGLGSGTWLGGRGGGGGGRVTGCDGLWRDARSRSIMLYGAARRPDESPRCVGQAVGAVGQ